MSARLRKFVTVAPLLGCLALLCLTPQLGFVAQLAHAQDGASSGLPPEMAELQETGLAALEAEDWKEAIKNFDQLIKALGNTPYAPPYLGRAKAYQELEDYANAITDYSTAIQFQDDLAQAYNGRGVCSRERGEFDLAYNDFQTAAELDRADGSIAANLGDLLVNQYRDPTQAMSYLDKAIEADPENAEAYRNRGWGHVLLRESEEAIVDLDKAIELDPEDYETYQRLASVYLIDLEYPKAIGALEKTIEFYKAEDSSDPEIYLSGYLQLAEAKINLAKEKDQTAEQRQVLYNDAVAHADTLLAIFPDRFPESGQALHIRGMGLRLQSRFAEAITSFTDAIQIIPAGREVNYISESYRTRGICWFYQGQISLARGDFREAVSLNVDDPLPYLWIGFSYAQEEDYRKAIESYGKAAAKSPTFSLAFVNRGIAYMQLSDYSKAVDNFNQAIRAEPTEPAHFCKRGLAHEHLEEFQKALDSYTLALLRDDQMVIAHQGSARALRALGKPRLAEMHDNKVRAISSQKN